MTEAKTFKERLEICADRGGLSVADLAAWFDRGYATTRYWLLGNKDHDPQDGPRANRSEALKRLTLLEWAVQNVHGFPVSPRLTRDKRDEWVRRLYVESARLYTEHTFSRSGVA